ncbi:MAG TPA: acetylxylan esterase [bacterium]|nr:acetylxylan esterase [bacterium]
MNRKFTVWFAVFFVCAGIARAAEENYLSYYEYDNKAPLKERWAGMQGHPYYNLYKVIYTSVNDERVPGFYFEPRTGSKPFPCVIMQHGYMSSKMDSKSMGLLTLIKAGYAVFAIDAQYHGERRVPGKDIFSPDIENDARAIVQTIIDLRRGIDLLETRKEIDSDRITYIGVSMGGILGSIFSGVDERVKAPVLVVGGGDWKTLVSQSEIGPARLLRKRINSGRLESIDELASMMKHVEPLNFIGLVSPRPLLMINNKHDKIVPTDANKLLHAAAEEPKKIVWLDGIPGDPTGHIPPINEVTAQAIQWWKEKL